MRSIQNTFNKIRNKQPALGSYCVLAESVKNRRFTKDSIVKAFKTLVPQDEYENSEKTQLIKYLYLLSQTLVDTELRVKNQL